MREIKFRAWDSSIRRMLYQTNMEYFDDMIAFRINLDMLGDAQEIIIMQYTGLIDKNGKEIYEGDIIDIHQTVNGCNLFVVIWSDIGFSVRYLIDGEVSREYEYEYDIKELLEVNVNKYDKEIEVIGNIYDNPELLEIKK